MKTFAIWASAFCLALIAALACTHLGWVDPMPLLAGGPVAGLLALTAAATATPPVIKNRAAYDQATKWRAEADELRKKMLDPAIKMTKDEVEKAAAAINDLEFRAAKVLEITPQDEINRQGGDTALRLAGPDSDEPEVVTVKERIDGLHARVMRAFGSVDEFVKYGSGRFQTRSEKKNALIREAHDLARELFPGELSARTIIGTTGDASGGEFLLPLQQVPSIFMVPNVQEGILQYAQKYAVTGRTLRIPYVVQTDATGGKTRPMAGIAAISIVGEGAEKGTREPSFEQRLLTVYKWAAIWKIGDETAADDFTGQGPQSVATLVGGQIINEFNDYMTVVGSGTAQPLAALHANNGALLVVHRDTTMSVDTTDIFRLWTRHTHGPGSYWSCSRRVMEQIFALHLSGNTLVTFLQNLAGKPGMSLLGYPLRVNDLQPTLGVQSDLALINPAFYAAAVRTQLTIESSIHVEFVKDITTYRAFARGGGIPIPTGTFAYKAPAGVKVDEHSPFVVLGDAASS